MEKQNAGLSLKADERDELNRLRKEVKNLRMEKEMLKRRVLYLRRK